MRLIPARLKGHPRLGEVVGLLLALVAVLTFAALVSYDPRDASYGFHAGRGSGHVANWIGRGGATLAEALLQLFGAAALLAPLGALGLGWRALRAQSPAPLWIGGAAGASLAAITAALVHLLFGNIAYHDQPLPAGGFVGGLVARPLAGLFGVPGAVLVILTLILSIVVLASRFSLARTVELGLARTRLAATHLRPAAGQALRALRQRLTRARPATVEAPPPRVPREARPREVEPPESRPLLPLPAAAPSASGAETPPVAAARPTKPQAKPPKQIPLPIEPPARGYRLPPIELLNAGTEQSIESEAELLARAGQITEKLKEFALHGQVVAIHPGPVVTIFEFKPEPGIKYSKLTGMTDDLCLALKAESVRIDRMHGRSTVGIEVPNRRQETIYARDLLASERFQSSPSRLTLALGKGISGEVYTADLDRMPHLLIAGATGAGKSVGINGMIASVLYKATPDDVRFIMIDTKMIELGIYADIPHLLVPVVTEAKHASTALKWACREMEQRYRKLAAVGVRNIAQFNKLLKDEPGRTMDDPKGGAPLPLTHLPYIVIVIDELADLMMIAASDVEESIMRLAQMARAVGIHLIIATQRPSVDVITGTIKANFPSRVAFRVSQRVDSRTIIDQQGAEHLLGRGDMLFLPTGSSRLFRVHGAMITEAELNRITAYIKKMAAPIYDESVLVEPGETAEGFDASERDEMYLRAVRTVIQEGKCSVTLIQRRLQLGYARAARIVDMMEHEGVVGPGEGSKPREILVGPEFLEADGTG